MHMNKMNVSWILCVLYILSLSSSSSSALSSSSSSPFSFSPLVSLNIPTSMGKSIRKDRERGGGNKCNAHECHNDIYNNNLKKKLMAGSRFLQRVRGGQLSDTETAFEETEEVVEEEEGQEEQVEQEGEENGQEEEEKENANSSEIVTDKERNTRKSRSSSQNKEEIEEADKKNIDDNRKGKVGKKSKHNQDFNSSSSSSSGSSSLTDKSSKSDNNNKIKVSVILSCGSKYLDKKLDLFLPSSTTILELKEVLESKFPGNPPKILQKLYYGSQYLGKLYKDTSIEEVINEHLDQLKEAENEDEDEGEGEDKVEDGQKSSSPKKETNKSAAVRLPFMLDMVPPLRNLTEDDNLIETEESLNSGTFVQQIGAYTSSIVGLRYATKALVDFLEENDDIEELAKELRTQNELKKKISSGGEGDPDARNQDDPYALDDEDHDDEDDDEEEEEEGDDERLTEEIQSEISLLTKYYKESQQTDDTPRPTESSLTEEEPPLLPILSNLPYLHDSLEWIAKNLNFDYVYSTRVALSFVLFAYTTGLSKQGQMGMLAIVPLIYLSQVRIAKLGLKILWELWTAFPFKDQAFFPFLSGPQQMLCTFNEKKYIEHLYGDQNEWDGVNHPRFAKIAKGQGNHKKRGEKENDEDKDEKEAKPKGTRPHHQKAKKKKAAKMI